MRGGHLKLDPRDLYALGVHRGGTDTRWFPSTTEAANGPLAAEDEGRSYIDVAGKRTLLRLEVGEIGADFLAAAVFAMSSPRGARKGSRVRQPPFVGADAGSRRQRDGRRRLLREVDRALAGFYSAKDLTVSPQHSAVIRTRRPNV